jgi:signal transduction histidine kinase
MRDTYTQHITWNWLRNLLKLIEDYTDTKKIIETIQSSFRNYLKFETAEIFIVERPNEKKEERSYVDKLASSNFFSREVIEEIFLHKRPCRLSSSEIIYPLENEDRILGLFHLKSQIEINDVEQEIIWSFCDGLSTKLDNIIFPIKFSPESKLKIKEISNSIFNNLKGFLEASLERLKLLEDENLQLVKLNETRTELINNVSHELRTPLVSIMGFSKILQRREVDQALIKEASDQIQSAGSRLSRMIDDLIQLNRANTRGWEIIIENLDIGEITYFIIETLSPLHKDHRFICDFPEDYPLIDGDRKLLRQVIENLFLNAIKYSPDGGEIKCKIRMRNDLNKLFFSIEDQGIGMTKEEVKKVFDRFYRAKNNFTENIAGLGLGLSICKDVVEAINGNIYCESEFGKGSKFTIELNYGN